MGIVCLLSCLLIEEEVVQESPKKFAYLQLVVQTVENGEVSSIVFFRCQMPPLFFWESKILLKP
jgi:hypothetical protein